MVVLLGSFLKWAQLHVNPLNLPSFCTIGCNGMYVISLRTLCFFFCIHLHGRLVFFPWASTITPIGVDRFPLSGLLVTELCVAWRSSCSSVGSTSDTFSSFLESWSLSSDPSVSISGSSVSFSGPSFSFSVSSASVVDSSSWSSACSLVSVVIESSPSEPSSSFWHLQGTLKVLWRVIRILFILKDYISTPTKSSTRSTAKNNDFAISVPALAIAPHWKYY